MTARRPTSRDVARLAGVSQSTVSYVLTNRPGISEATRDRVQRAAEELSYRPNLAARSMRTHRTGRIAIVMPITAWNPPSLLAGATAAAQDAGYAVEVQSLPSAGLERDAHLAELVGSGQFEGILSFVPVRAPAGEHRTTVFFATEFDDEMHAAEELSDPFPLMEMMTELSRLGHRRFLHITGALDYRSARSRRDTYLTMIERLGAESLGVIEGDWSARAGLDAVRTLADDAPPLAIIAANDLVATGVVRGVHERGWTVPEDVSVTGWDDYPTSAFQLPSLTSVIQDRGELGARSVRRLVALMRDEPAPEEHGSLQSVVWRESTGRPRSAPAGERIGDDVVPG